MNLRIILKGRSDVAVQKFLTIISGSTSSSLPNHITHFRLHIIVEQCTWNALGPLHTPPVHMCLRDAALDALSSSTASLELTPLGCKNAAIFLITSTLGSLYNMSVNTLDVQVSTMSSFSSATSKESMCGIRLLCRLFDKWLCYVTYRFYHIRYLSRLVGPRRSEFTYWTNRLKVFILLAGLPTYPYLAFHTNTVVLFHITQILIPIPRIIQRLQHSYHAPLMSTVTRIETSHGVIRSYAATFFITYELCYNTNIHHNTYDVLIFMIPSWASTTASRSIGAARTNDFTHKTFYHRISLNPWKFPLHVQ